MTTIVPFDAKADWPDPDLTIGQPVRPPAPVMNDDDFRTVFGPWADWLHDAAQVKGAPVDYVALALLTTAGACIGNSRWVAPWSGWKEPPVLWGMLVGDPSAGKSPALDAVLDGVKAVEVELTDTYRTARAEWDDADEVAKLVLAQWKAEVKKALGEGSNAPSKPEQADAGAPPIRERIRIADATIEKVAELLATSWRGLLMCRDELSGWLANMERYSSGADRPFWLEANGGRSYTIDRKANPEPVVVDHLSVGVLGGTQPDKLDSLLVKTDDDGLLARFLTVWPDPMSLVRPTKQLDETRLIDAIKRLRDLQPAKDENGNLRPFYLDLTEAAQNALQSFREQCRDWEAGAEGLFKGHIGKLPGLSIRVACVLAHLDHAWAGDGPPTVIEQSHMGRACHLVGEHYRGHAFRAYGKLRLPPEIQGAKVIAQIIRDEQLRLVKVRDIQNRQRSGLNTASAVKAGLAVLLDADWLREVREVKGGRPAVSYAVNPKLEGAS